MAYSMDPIQDGCYPGTAVLVSKFDIREDAKLNEVEAVLVSARSAEWTNQPRADSFDFAHYKAVHCFLLSLSGVEVYARRVNPATSSKSDRILLNAATFITF